MAYESTQTQPRPSVGILLISSPVGQALVGRRAGETATVSLPDGRTRRLRIASVAPPT
jgi:transcription elongation GreA/GreB family factor